VVGDSRREAPHFFKIMDVIGIDSTRMRLYGLDRSKKSSDGATTRSSIEKVPTFIFLRNGVEIGRVTEKPVVGLEADILTILADSSKK